MPQEKSPNSKGVFAHATSNAFFYTSGLLLS